MICSSARAVRKQRRRADVRDEPAVGEAGADADHVLLGDADVDEPIGELVAERAELRRADGVVDDGDDALVGAGKIEQRRGERITAVVQRRARRTGPSAAPPSSDRATSYSSAVGTRWCHDTSSVMNVTPVPLIVWAIRQLGLPVSNGTALNAASSASWS